MALPEEINIQKSIFIKHSINSLYDLLRNFEKLPYLLDFLENIIVIDSTHSRWTAKIGVEQERIIWDVEITREKENSFIEWHSSGNTDILHEGIMRFSNSNSHRGTNLSLQLRFYFPPSEEANSLGDEFESRIEENLTRFKQAIEANEFPRPRENRNNIPEGFKTDEGPTINFA